MIEIIDEIASRFEADRGQTRPLRRGSKRRKLHMIGRLKLLLGAWWLPSWRRVMVLVQPVQVLCCLCSLASGRPLAARLRARQGHMQRRWMPRLASVTIVHGASQGFTRVDVYSMSESQVWAGSPSMVMSFVHGDEMFQLAISCTTM